MTTQHCEALDFNYLKGTENHLVRIVSQNNLSWTVTQTMKTVRRGQRGKSRKRKWPQNAIDLDWGFLKPTMDSTNLFSECSPTMSSTTKDLNHTILQPKIQAKVRSINSNQLTGKRRRRRRRRRRLAKSANPVSWTKLMKLCCIKANDLAIYLHYFVFSTIFGFYFRPFWI